MKYVTTEEYEKFAELLEKIVGQDQSIDTTVQQIKATLSEADVQNLIDLARWVEYDAG